MLELLLTFLLGAALAWSLKSFLMFRQARGFESRLFDPALREGLIHWDQQASATHFNDAAIALLELQRGKLCMGADAPGIARQIASRHVPERGEMAEGSPGPYDGLNYGALRTRTGRWLRLSTSRLPRGGAITVVSDITESGLLLQLCALSSKTQAMRQAIRRIVHDYNNAFTVGLGNLELLEATLQQCGQSTLPVVTLAKRAREGLGRAMEMNRRLSGYLSEFPEVSRPLHPADIVREAVNRFRTRDDTAAEIRIEITEPDACVLADPDDLVDAVCELLRNATESSPVQSTVSVKVTSEVVVRSRLSWAGQRILQSRYVRIDVMDRGCGISRDDLERVFDPFYSTKGIKGAGLGLSRVAGFCGRHRGAADVDSSPGSGSCFMIYLPFVTSSAESTA